MLQFYWHCCIILKSRIVILSAPETIKKFYAVLWDVIVILTLQVQL
jgi:hypothetical protein